MNVTRLFDIRKQKGTQFHFIEDLLDSNTENLTYMVVTDGIMEITQAYKVIPLTNLDPLLGKKIITID